MEKIILIDCPVLADRKRAGLVSSAPIRAVVMRILVTFVVLLWCGALALRADTYYVAQGGQTPISPYDTWTKAASNIQDAISVAIVADDIVLVSNGTYQAGGVTNWPSGSLLTNRVAITNAITVRSANNDPTNTIIKGAGPIGDAAVRCVYMVDNSSLVGFTLTNGATLGRIGAPWAAGGDTNDGGGAYCQSTAATISNCVIISNSADYRAGGVYAGTLYNCTLIGNSAYLGGGAHDSTLFNCTVSENFVTRLYCSAGGVYDCTLSNCTLIGNSTRGNGSIGGGATYGLLYNCTLSGNTSKWWGGGAFNAKLTNCTIVGNSGQEGGGARSCVLYNCTIVSNSVSQYGGGVFESTLYNCLLSGNTSYWDGGGAYSSTLYNCTVAENTAVSNGGGVYAGSLYNTIVYFNTALDGSNWWNVSTFTHTCTAPAATNGAGNIGANPIFVNTNAANYRLSVNSPCINSGTNYSWMTNAVDVRSVDLDGNRRIDRFSGRVDMGSYELAPKGTLFRMY